MTGRMVATALGGLLVFTAIFTAVVWSTCRIYVPENMCAVLIRKTGSQLPPGQLVATEPGQRGIQQEVLGPGRHFYNPYSWDWEIKPLTVIPAGNPSSWEWIHSREKQAQETLGSGPFVFKGEFPQIGLVVRKVGSEPAHEQVIVDRASGQKGILREVLTPGTYKINPYIYDVELHNAIVIPAGFVGVVTNLFGDPPSYTEAAGLLEAMEPAGDSMDPASDASPGSATTSRSASTVLALAEPGQRGTLRDVLQPGVYFINPKLQKVTLIEIGFNEYSQVKISEKENYRISFPSDTGYLIRVGVTVVWGVAPQHAAQIINEFGNIDGVLEKIIGPQLRSICRNIGSNYSARDFIQGEKRELFQKALTAELKRVCGLKNIEVSLALIREIEVDAPSTSGKSQEVTEDLKRTIQESHIAIENQITKEKQRAAATVRAQLEEVRKQVDIARENIKAETRVLVAQTQAEGEKKAAQIDAQAALEVATIQQEVAALDAQRVEIMGAARADVEKLKNAAEAEGYRLLVDAFGSSKAYNLYTFAENFKPESIRLFFAGEGTFWTDLTRLEEAGAAKMLDETGPPHRDVR